MAATTHSLTTYLDKADESVKTYFNTVLETFKSLNLDSRLGEWVIFGGFIRDIIAGIPYEQLITKDVDMYFIYKLHSRPEFSYNERADYMLNPLKTRPDVKFIKYSLTDKESLPFTEYAIARIEVNNITFDLGFECVANRFESNFDFRCNSLYCPIKDLELKQRLTPHMFSDFEQLSVERCINDINEKRLVSIVTFFSLRYVIKVEYLKHLKTRRAKMISYGYQPVDDDIKLIDDVCQNHLKVTLERIGTIMNDQVKQQTKMEKALKEFQDLTWKRMEIYKQLLTINANDDEQRKLLIVALWDLNCQGDNIFDEVNRTRSMKYTERNLYNMTDVLIQVNDTICS